MECQTNAVTWTTVSRLFGASNLPEDNLHFEECYVNFELYNNSIFFLLFSYYQGR